MTQTTQAPSLDVTKLSVENALGKLIDYAVTAGASDMFIASEENSVDVSMRALGTIRAVGKMPGEQGRRVVAHLKALSGMDLNERRRPIDGRWIHHDDDGELIDMRISALPTIHGEDIALRLLPRGQRLFQLDKIGLSGEQFDRVSEMVDGLGGMILITGPTGAGKTATLYAALQRLHNGERKINTIEDPVEYTLPGIHQSSVNLAAEVNYADLLRSVLRQSPDVIMIGEIRDAATAATAVHAANSGLLVLATVHAGHAAGAVQTMRSLGVLSPFLASCLRGVIAQRLIRTICPACKTGFDLTDAPQTFDEVREWLGEGEGKKLWTAPGCDVCGGLGYGGRTGVFEVMPISRSLQSLISDGHSVRSIRDEALKEKMMTFRQAALLKVARGITNAEEVFRVIPAEQMVVDD